MPDDGTVIAAIKKSAEAFRLIRPPRNDYAALKRLSAPKLFYLSDADLSDADGSNAHAERCSGRGRIHDPQISEGSDYSIWDNRLPPIAFSYYPVACGGKDTIRR